MDEKTKSRIFEPFFSTKGKGKGTGLGLSTVYGIIKQSGGNIWVDSEFGHGTTFKIFMPRVEAEAESFERREIKSARGAGEFLLVVEDEYALRELIGTKLKSFGYRLKVVANSGEALLAVEEEGLRPELLLTDVVLPGISGAVLAKRLRKTQPGLKVLYMSGYTDNAIVHHGVLDSDTPFIQKPFNIENLADKIQEVLKAK